MYDMPVYGGDGGHVNRGNFLVNTLGAVLHGRPLCFSSGQYRGITYVRQVVRLLDAAASLPGGVYNYGSENSLNMLETAKALLDALGLELYIRRKQDEGQDLR
jgi:dTDP-4-dehydrorhamnose reductase